MFPRAALTPIPLFAEVSPDDLARVAAAVGEGGIAIAQFHPYPRYEAGRQETS